MCVYATAATTSSKSIKREEKTDEHISEEVNANERKRKKRKTEGGWENFMQ